MYLYAPSLPFFPFPNKWHVNGRKRENANWGMFLLIFRPESMTKLKFLVQHGLNTLQALEKHGLQPALTIHWARSSATDENVLLRGRISIDNIWCEFVEIPSISFLQQGSSLAHISVTRTYMGQSIYYWKKILITLETIKKNKSIPEPTECAASFKASSNTAQEKVRLAFAKKEGQWDCNICSVRNKPTAS